MASKDNNRLALKLLGKSEAAMSLSVKQCIHLFSGVRSKYPFSFLLGTKIYNQFSAPGSKGFKNLRNVKMNCSDIGMWFFVCFC